MTKFLLHELGNFHSVNRKSIQKFEIFTDFGLDPDHIVEMCRRMRINIVEEGDLVWIAYFYCGFLLKFSQKNNTDLVNFVIKS